MIISHKYKYIFIKNLKVAGSSLELFLSQFVGSGDIVTPVDISGSRTNMFSSGSSEKKEGVFQEGDKITPEICRKHFGRDTYPQNTDSIFKRHMSLWELNKVLSKSIFKNYYKFCVDRHPVDKAVSHFYWKKHRSLVKTPVEYTQRSANFTSNFGRYSISAKCAVDKVIRFENIADDMHEVCARLNIPFNGDLGFRCKAESRDKHIDKNKIFDDTIQKKIWEANVLENNLLQWRSPEEVDPSGSETLYAKANLLFREKKLFRALSRINKSIRISPEKSKSYLFKSKILEHYGLIKRALKNINRAIEIDPNDPNLHLFAGLILKNHKKEIASKQHFRYAIHIDSNCAPAYYQLASLLTSRNDYSEARFLANKAYAIKPNKKDFKTLAERLNN